MREINRKSTLIPVVIALVAMPLLVSTVVAGGSSSYRFNGKYLYAVAGSYVEGDLITNVFIQPYLATWKYPNEKLTTATMLGIYIFQFDPMSEMPTIMIDENVPISETDFSIDKKLTSANLDVTVSVLDMVSMSYVDLTIDVEWTGVGSMMKYSDSWHYKSDYSIQNGHYSNVFGEAIAVGSISMTDFSVSDWMFAELDFTKDSWVDVPKL